MFSKKLIENTGRVKGYIRKFIPLAECRFLPVEIILEKLTEGKFPNCTYNHSMALGRKVFKKHNFLLQKLFHPKENIAIMNNDHPKPFKPCFNVPTNLNKTYTHDVFPTVNGIIPVKKINNEVIGAEIFFKKINLPDEEKDKLLNYPVKEYIDHNIESKEFGKKIKDFLAEKTAPIIPYSIFAVLSAKEREKFAEAIEKCEEYFYFGFPGLSLTKKGRTPYYNADTESGEILFGFGGKNQVFRNYLSEFCNFLKFMKKNSKEDLTWDLLLYNYSEILHDIETLMQDIDKNGETPQTDLDNYNIRLGHPLIPVVINHSSISNLRWCHADYAAFMTKHGYNVIEMIT